MAAELAGHLEHLKFLHGVAPQVAAPDAAAVSVVVAVATARMRHYLAVESPSRVRCPHVQQFDSRLVFQRMPYHVHSRTHHSGLCNYVLSDG